MTAKMMASVWTGPEQVETREVVRPEPTEDEVLVRVAYAGICGTDLMIYLGKHPRAQAPLIMSHEFVGTLASEGIAGLPVGTPVAINPLLGCGECPACRRGIGHVCERLGLVGIDRDGGFAQYAAVPKHTVRPLPRSLPLARAALIEPLAVAVHAVRASRLQVGDLTAVLGAGPVGILTAQMARLAGTAVYVSEVSPRRISIARRLGFAVIDARNADPVAEIMRATQGEGVPVVFETAGVQATIAQSGQVARVQGQILQVGMPKTPPQIDLTPLLFREIEITPIRVYRDEDFDLAIRLAAADTLQLEEPVTHILPLNELEKGIHLSHEATDACKVLISPGAEGA
jgi:(R,R)-butanediol dehydrogenase / meso-butanediol dehydrogenase / diacetyl reductase